MKKSALFVLMLSLMLGLVASKGYGHSNSAPTFECIVCHEGDMASDMVKVEGLPKAYVPGKTYPLTIVVTSDLKNDGDYAGGFALESSSGNLIVSDKKHTQIVDGMLTHTQEGASARKWTFKWKAPKGKGEMKMNVMAVAANGDFSSMGDTVGTNAYTVPSAK